jgi:hypothetical protein
MSLRKDIEQNFRRLMEKVDRVSDKEAGEDFDDLDDKDLDNDGDTDSSDRYLKKRLSKVAKMDEKEDDELEEISTTAGVPGFDSPYAFGKVDDDTIEADGWKKTPKTNKFFKRMESKSYDYKKMMSEMYGIDSINEAANPQMDKLVRAFIDKIADRNGYPTSEAIMAVFESLKRQGFLHKSVDYKSPSGYSIDEAVSYREYKKDESTTPSQKVNKSIMEVNKMLAEIERVVAHNLKLKNESGVNSGQFWKSTGARFSKINERIVRISNRLKELSK